MPKHVKRRMLLSILAALLLSLLAFTMPVSKIFGDLALQIMSPYPNGITPGETYRQLVDRPDTATEPEPQPGSCPAGGCKLFLVLIAGNPLPETSQPARLQTME